MDDLRKTQEFVVTDEGRDKGKVFVIKEADALRVEKFAIRAGLLAVQAGVNLPGAITGMGGLVVAGLQTVMALRFDQIEPLLDEMLTTVTIRPDPMNRNPDLAAYQRKLMPGDFQEVMTLAKLREAIIELHVGFSIAGYLSRLSQEPATSEGSPNTETSPQPLQP